ncbi:gamma-glutamyltransferase, partial [Acinetobacter baumannii]
DGEGKPIPFADGVLGGRAVGVPGTPRLLAELHRRHGRLPWARLFDPVIRLAEQGFAMSPRLVTLLGQEKALRNDPLA